MMMNVQWLLVTLAVAAVAHLGSVFGETSMCGALPQTAEVLPSSYGKDFFVAVPSTFLFGLVSQVIIGTSSNASYSVETAAGVVQTGSVSFNSPATVTFSINIVVAGSDYTQREKGIHVRATGMEPVFILVTTISLFGFGDYIAYPCQSFERDNYEYYAVSTTSTSSGFLSQVVLVACENDTEVMITPTETVNLPVDAQDPNSSHIDILAGNNHTVTLNQMQTLLIATSGADLTGTKIVSNKPLTVISGHECGNVPESVNFCEQIAVQVPPTSTWGSEFLLAPFTGRTSGQYYKVVASSNDTTVVYKCGTSSTLGTVLSDAGESFLFRTESSQYCYLFTDKPVFVVQMATGGSVDNLGDPVMANVPPIPQYVSSASFVPLTSVTIESHAISVTVAKEHFRSLDIIFDGMPMNCIWNEIVNLDDCVVGFGCNINVTTGSHTVSHRGEGGLLSVTAYGFDSTPLQGYAYTAGMNVQLREQPVNETGPDIPIVELPEVVPYFDLEDFPGVEELRREKDANSAAISIPLGLLFGDRIVTTAYVSENGVISFDAEWKFAHPSRFPTEYFYTRNAYAAAPFWSDNDIRKEGIVRYVAIMEGNGARGDDMLRVASSFVQGQRQENDTRDEFRGTWMLVAQWDRVHPDPHGADDHMSIPEALLERTNTYQAVIITDGVYSSTLFTYTCGDLEWSATGNRPAVVGYNAGGTYFENHRSSGFDTVANDVSCVVELRRSKRQTGGMMQATGSMEIDIDEVLMQSTAACREKYNIDDTLIPNPDDSFDDPVMPCPCNLMQARIDQRFMMDTMFRPDSTCYLQDSEVAGTNVQGPISYTQQCCYANNGALYTSSPDAGTLVITEPILLHDDNQFYDSCCSGDGRGCELFYSRRTIGTCEGYSPPACCGHGTGDPHYRDVTGRYFDFHGDGEFLLLEIGPERSQLQGILSRLGRSTWGVAVHRSFAFGEPGRFAYQMVNPVNFEFILLKTQGEGTENGAVDILPQLGVGMTYTDSTNRLWITRTRSNTISVIFSSGLFFDLTWYSQHGDVRNVKVLQRYTVAQQSRGIMGSTRSGNWQIQPEQSMFAIHRDRALGRKRRQVTAPNLDFVFPDPPVPFSIENLNYTDEQREFCNNITECMFDLLLTGDTEIATTTMEANIEGTRQEIELGNFPPNITGESVFNVTVGQRAVYNFTVVDEEDTFTVEVVGEIPEGATFEDSGEGDYTFSWNLEVVTNRSDVPALSFQANDSAGAVSLLTPQLVVCPCTNDGECTLRGILNTALPVLVMNCICPEAYGGEFCEEDRNGCSEIECFEGVECLDVPAPGVGAMCGTCPDGYTGDGEKCFDIDECEMDSTLCEQICNNTIGSYECKCEDGYQLVAGTNQCTDIDECELREMNDCQQECTNTVGSFNCSCQEGFTLNADGRNCDANQPCAGNGGCSGTCAVIDGVQQCFCPTGFVLNRFDQQTCIDNDECVPTNPCNQTCTNTFGSFECSCADGYMLLSDMTSCGDIDECLEAVANQRDICPANTACVNTIGSFQCVCVPGYELVDGTCQRIVESVTSAPLVQQVLPNIGENNEVNFTVTTFSVVELTAEVIQRFRRATAQAVTRYCSETPCVTINSTNHNQSVTGLTAVATNVAVPRTNIREDARGNPVLSFYVQFSSSVFLSADTLATAVMQAEDLYQEVGYIPRECNITCPDGYTVFDDCSGCELTDICLAETPCLNGGTCYVVRAPNDYRCDCPEATEGARCEGAVNCSTLSNQANGRVSHTAGTAFGQPATYSCDTGYNLVGDSTRMCQANGRWSGSEPICQAVDCGTLNNPANGQVSHTGRTTYRQTATYSCDTGYNLVGVSTRTCQATRVWSGSEPTCQIVDCGNLTNPTNGQVSTSTGRTTFGQTATYSCDTGYNLVGGTQRTCQATGVWSGSVPVCQVEDCGTLNAPANGRVTHTGRTTFGQTATYSCDTGYNLVGDSNHTCRATGVWSGCAPTCQVVDCGTLTNPANGQVSHAAGTTFRQTATYSCDTGYILVGDNNRTCQATGVWSGSEPICQTEDCGTLTHPTNGQVSHTAGTTYQQTATYSCDTGYNLVGDNTRICHATGVWSGSAPTCHVVYCGTLTNPANGQVSHTAVTTFGQTATYSCDLGYNLVGNNNRTCQATGRWSGNTPTCQAVDCGTLTNPANGRVTHTGRTTFGQTATYSCDTGYNLVGDNNRTCQATGVWSESEPICQIVGCGTLTNPTNGQVNHTAGATFGQTATYSCDTGYNLVGDSTRICQDGGVWSGSEPNCQVVDCGTLTNPANGQVSHTAEATFGQTATYSCDTGYILMGDSTRTCQATGRWSGNTPTCQAVDCGTLTNLANGRVSHTGRTTFEQTATYSCDTGYILVGDNNRTCQATGVWSGSEPICQNMNCSTLTDPSNGQVSYTAGTTFRQTATYSCDTGYNLVGDSTRICHDTGVWSGSEPTCQVVDCGTLTDPANGQVSHTAGTTFGQTATYSCDTGYNLVGDNNCTCQATGRWSGNTPTCQVVDCGTLTDPANGQVNNTAGRTFGQTVTYSCDLGYNLVGENTRICQADGIWSGIDPSCQVVDCGTQSNPVNGQVSHTAGTTFGQTATYSCDTGYNLVGDSNHTCRATGVWSGCAPTCQAVNCGTLTDPANGQVNHTAGTTFGQRAAYTCDVGYNLVGENIRTCQAGGVWSGNAPTCQAVNCSTLNNPANGQVSYTAETTFGQTATYSCDTGYNLVGSSTRTCQATGRWSGSEPTCQVVDCGTLTNPANGQVSHTAGTTFGQPATYSCDLGYTLVGESNRSCQAIGRWSGNTPTCQAVDCGTLTNPVNGQVTHTGRTRFGQTATYSCDTGYNLVGYTQRICQATGVWSGSEPICQIVECGTQNNPDNGQVTHANGTTFGQTATYSCDTGYNLVGDSTRMCQATGVWSGSAPICQVVNCGTLNAPASGQVSHTAGTTFGQTATYSCDLGYNLVGESNHTCQATGRWSGNTPTCQVVDCGTLTNPANGQVTHTGRTVFTQTATYSCDTGYHLVGDNNRTCQATAVWSGRAPTCQEVDECARGTDRCHQSATCNNTQGSYICSCNTGYTGDGFSCTDIDECFINNGGCHHNCQNSEGSFRCSCNDGYQLNSDGYSCEATATTVIEQTATSSELPVDSRGRLAATECAVPATSIQSNLPLVIGVTGGAGLIMIITIAIVIVGCVIMKRRQTVKLTLSGKEATSNTQKNVQQIKNPAFDEGNM